MHTDPTKRMRTWIWLLGGLVLLFALPLAANWLATFDWKVLKHPQSKHIGPFTLRAWYLPERFSAPSASALCDVPGLVVKATELISDAPPQQYGWWKLLSLLQPASTPQPYPVKLMLLPDKRQTLTIAHDYGLGPPALGRAFNSLGDGVGLGSQGGTETKSGGIAEVELLFSTTLEALGSNRYAPKTYRYIVPICTTSGYYEDNSIIYDEVLMLNGSRIAVMNSSPSGQAPLQLAVASPDTRPLHTSGDGTTPFSTVVQTLPDVVKAGPAFFNGLPTWVMLQRPEKVYLLDRSTERFVERPELAPLAQAALADKTLIDTIALSGLCLAVRKTDSSIKLYALDGSTATLKLDDPHPLSDPKGIIQGDYIAKRKAKEQFAAALRTAGESLPADRVSDTVDLLPLDADRLAVCDYWYNRFIIVQLHPAVR